MHCIQSGIIELGRAPITFSSFPGYFDLFFWGMFGVFFPRRRSVGIDLKENTMPNLYGT